MVECGIKEDWMAPFMQRSYKNGVDRLPIWVGKRLTFTDRCPARFGAFYEFYLPDLEPLVRGFVHFLTRLHIERFVPGINIG